MWSRMYWLPFIKRQNKPWILDRGGGTLQWICNKTIGYWFFIHRKLKIVHNFSYQKLDFFVKSSSIIQLNWFKCKLSWYNYLIARHRHQTNRRHMRVDLSYTWSTRSNQWEEPSSHDPSEKNIAWGFL